MNEGANIYWEEHGRGMPVLLIMGLSFTLEMWFRILPSLVDRYRVILFDNRGVGRSSVPNGPYTIPRMSRDAQAVLDAAGVTRAHVVGASMGGMIAQELALRNPAVVDSLTLACTSHSGLFGRWPDFNCVPRGFGNTRLERERSVIKLLYSDSTPRERIEEDINLRVSCNWCRKGFLNQFAGILLWSAYRRLPRLQKPTLIVHGDEDRMVPIENGRVLAQRISGARFVPIRGAGHVMTTDKPEECSAAIQAFLNEQRA
jgi:pimeloyl-ACP methyl ester carboxylesterase